MKFTIYGLCAIYLFAVPSCLNPSTTEQKKPTKPTIVIEAPETAFSMIKKIHDGIEADCGVHLSEIDIKSVKNLELYEVQQEEADKLLERIGLMARQCGDYDAPESRSKTNRCRQDCSWCPVKWYWCVENAGACAGGDHTSCCRLGACGSKSHCETVCKSSCSCNVPPLP